MSAKPPLPPHTRAFARKLRAKCTDAEQKLWRHLRRGNLYGLKFRRQHPVPPYIVDFYCHELKLAVELDGSQHTPTADAARSQFLQRQGLTILRFWDNQALQETESVLEAILDFARTRGAIVDADDA